MATTTNILQFKLRWTTTIATGAGDGNLLLALLDFQDGGPARAGERCWIHFAVRTECQGAVRAECQGADGTYCQGADGTECQGADGTECQGADGAMA